VNPAILGIRLDMLVYLYRRRLRAQRAGELLAGAGVAVGVALVFGVLLANVSLTGSARRLVGGLAGSARWELVARSAAGMPEALVRRAGEEPGVLVAAPVLRENVTVAGASGERAVQLIGLTPSVEALGGADTAELAAGAALLKGGLGLPSGVADALGAGAGSPLAVAARGTIHFTRVRILLGRTLKSVAASPVVVASLPVAQALAGRPGRVSELLIRPAPGGDGARVRAELARLAAGAHLDLRAADAELGLLSVATAPSRHSTSLFSAIAVMIGFLLALSAVLLTVPERRRFIAELRLLGYDSAQVALLLGTQALVLGVVAAAAGLALGYLLAHAFFAQVPGFLTAAFPIGAAQVVRPAAVAAAAACGVAAALLASLAPLLPQRDGAGALSGRAIRALALAGAALVAGACAAALLDARLTIAAGVALALACVCLAPPALWSLSHALPPAAERVRSGAVVVALGELRATTLRAAALAAIVCLATFGGVAIGGARSDLLRGIGRATDQYFATAPVWVTAGHDVFNTGAFPPGPAVAALSHASAVSAAAPSSSSSAPSPSSFSSSPSSSPVIAGVRVYRGGLLDIGERRVWVRARPAADSALLESTQLLHGDYATATRLIRAGGWAAVSSDLAEERGLHIGGALTLPTPAGARTVRVAAITTNSGWPAGALTLGAADFARWWPGGEAAALEVSLRPGVSAAAGRRAVAAALGAPRSAHDGAGSAHDGAGSGPPGAGMGTTAGLLALTAGERAAQSEASARQGLRTLAEISTLLLIAAALAVAAALSAAIWQRRARLASLKLQGYDSGQLWLSVLLESTVTIAAGALAGVLLGLLGHALAGRYLQLSTGFPAPFAPGPAQAAATVALLAAIALLVIALPGMAAARVSPRAVLQE
jgi:putative ABC transport system permease protein